MIFQSNFRIQMLANKIKILGYLFINEFSFTILKKDYFE